MPSFRTGTQTLSAAAFRHPPNGGTLTRCNSALLLSALVQDQADDWLNRDIPWQALAPALYRAHRCHRRNPHGRLHPLLLWYTGSARELESSSSLERSSLRSWQPGCVPESTPAWIGAPTPPTREGPERGCSRS